MSLTALNLYSVQVGEVAAFFVAAVDVSQARAIVDQWKSERGIAPSAIVRVERFTDYRYVYAPGV